MSLLLTTFNGMSRVREAASKPQRNGVVSRLRRVRVRRRSAVARADGCAYIPWMLPTIESYHAHIYYDVASTRDQAERLRERIGVSFPQATLGRWHDELVGPHPQSMYQVAFPIEMLAAFVPWLMLNREGLTVLLHPETGNAYRDHTAHAAWFGGMLPLRLEAFKNRDDD